MSEQLIRGAIKSLIDDSKKILIPNAISTLTANLNEASGYDDFYKIDYLKYGKRIIDNSNLSPKRKEEIHQRFKTPFTGNNKQCSESIKKKADFFSNPGEKLPKKIISPTKAQKTSSNLVSTNIAHYEDLITNPPVFRKTRYCLACKNPIEEKDLTFYSGYPYHSFCIKCNKCSDSSNNSTPKTIDNYICITQGMFLCRQHYQDYFSSKSISDEISTLYHEKNKDNFVKKVFSIPLENEEIIETSEEESENEIITPEIISESIPVKRPFKEFVPTFTVRFDKLPTEIDFKKLNELVGDDFVIVSVEKGSAIVQWAYIADCPESELEQLSFLKQNSELIEMKLKTTIGKAVVGNIISEPIYSIPDDKKIQDEYNKPWLNVLQNMHELDKFDLNYIKKSAIKVLKKSKTDRNWSFIFRHEKMYEEVEKQIFKDLKENDFELIIVAQTVITNKNIDKYNKIALKINKSNQRCRFLYHGTKVKNHQNIIKKHFLMPGQDFIKNTTDAGWFGKGIYATENMFYAAKYANGYKDLDYNEKTHVICCMAIYNDAKIVELNDLSLKGKKISDDVTNNYGIHHAFVGSAAFFHPIPKYEKEYNYISAEEFVFPNKYQIIPIYSFSIMRKDHFILWKDENVDNNENKKYFEEISKKTQVNIYNAKSVDKALEIIKRKRRNKFKLITNGGGIEQTGKKLIDEARKITQSAFVCLVFAYDERHLDWVSERTNVLFTSSSDDFKKFINLNLNEDEIYNFAIELQKKHGYKFKINKNSLLSFPPVYRSSYDG